MAGFQGEVVRDDKGREVVRFTTASGVRAVVATSIPAEALDKLARKLERQIARLLARPDGGSPESALQDEVACPVDQRDPSPAGAEISAGPGLTRPSLVRSGQWRSRA